MLASCDGKFLNLAAFVSLQKWWKTLILIHHISGPQSRLCPDRLGYKIIYCSISWWWGENVSVKEKSPFSWQIENAMFLNKVKEQQEKSASFSASPASHYQTTLLTIPTPGAKTDGGGQAGSAAHLHPPHSTQNITVLPVPSTGIMTAGGLVSVFRNL